MNSSLVGGAYGAAYAGMTGGDPLKGAAIGALGWAAGSAFNMLIGHAVGFTGSGFSGPKEIKDGFFIYEGNPWGHLTSGNVVWEQPKMTPIEEQHEIGGHGFQGTLLGPAYLFLHILDKFTFTLMLEYSPLLFGGAPTYSDLYPGTTPKTWWSIFGE